MSESDKDKEDRDKWIQDQVHKQMKLQYELHNWSAAKSGRNPLELIIELDDDDEDSTITIN